VAGIVYAEGHATVTTYRLNGTVAGNLLPENAAATNPERRNAEYNLYKTATSISEAYPANARPAPSAVYELLRFGRVINTAQETLNPADVPHWRRIHYPGGEGWVNLNATSVHKFSDADFPHWKHWSLIDDSADQDSRCDSPTIKGWFDTNHDAHVDAGEMDTGMKDTDTLAKLEHAICKFPTEWDCATIDKRWGWLKNSTTENPEALGEDDFAKFKAHAEALCFWGDIPAQVPALPASPWRMHPKLFIREFRKCGWLSANEFAQCIPRENRHLQGTQFIKQTVASWATARARATTWALYFARSTRKYGISSSHQRLLHFLAHVIPETGYLQFVKENDGEGQTYNPYYGRGLIQLTHAVNYRDYGDFRQFKLSHPIPTTPAPTPGSDLARFSSDLGWNPNDLIATSDQVYSAGNCADSAGFYIVKRNGMLKHLDAGISQGDAIAVSKDVNGYVAIENLNGLDIRLQTVVYLKYILLDNIRPASGAESITFQWRRNSSREPDFDAQGNPVMIPNTNPPQQKKKYFLGNHTIGVILLHQKP
jgi:hydroxyethylthiazole kinase